MTGSIVGHEPDADQHLDAHKLIGALENARSHAHLAKGREAQCWMSNNPELS